MAKRKFEELMEQAKELKDEYDEYIKENPPKFRQNKRVPDNLENLDDFLSDLGLDF